MPQVHRPGSGAACACRVSIQTGIRVLRPERASKDPHVAGKSDGADGPIAASNADLSTDGSPALIAAAAARVGGRYDRLLSAVWHEHGDRIRAAATRYAVPEDLVLAVIAIESAGQTGAVSPKGAAGLMQLMPETASRLGVRDRFDAAQNIDGGTALLSKLAVMFAHDQVMMLAAYNAGPHAVERYGGLPPYDETRNYVPRVLGAAAAARRLLAKTGL